MTVGVGPGRGGGAIGGRRRDHGTAHHRVARVGDAAGDHPLILLRERQAGMDQQHRENECAAWNLAQRGSPTCRITARNRGSDAIVLLLEDVLVRHPKLRLFVENAGYPALIVQCAGVADVRQAVMFAREHNLLVSIRGGGHGVTGNAVCNDGLVIDLTRMRSVPRFVSLKGGVHG